MCDPISMAIGMGLSVATTIAGGVMSSQAQSAQADAIRNQNIATQNAQNQAFMSRMDATRKQSQAQFDTAQRENLARTQIAAQMRQGQESALDQTNKVLTAENQTAEQLRARGDQAAQNLLQQTSGPNLDQAQTDYQTKAAALLAAAQDKTATGPEATDPSGSGVTSNTDDPVTKQAVARRMGIAAANIRQYGSDIARVASYGAPLQNISQAVTGTATGIMPAQAAESLLRGGAAVRLLPSQIAYRQATDYGGAADTAAQARAQGENTYAGLDFSNAMNIADLGQSDADTAAANIANQKKADAQFQAQLGSLTTSLGQLGMYGSGRYGPQILPTSFV